MTVPDCIAVTASEMEMALGSKDETFAYGGTIRRCIDCNRPVFGGPTRCNTCADKIITQPPPRFGVTPYWMRSGRHG
jgi:hypothetical protein